MKVIFDILDGMVEKKNPLEWIFKESESFLSKIEDAVRLQIRMIHEGDEKVSASCYKTLSTFFRTERFAREIEWRGMVFSFIGVHLLLLWRIKHKWDSIKELYGLFDSLSENCSRKVKRKGKSKQNVKEPSQDSGRKENDPRSEVKLALEMLATFQEDSSTANSSFDPMLSKVTNFLSKASNSPGSFFDRETGKPPKQDSTFSSIYDAIKHPQILFNAFLGLKTLSEKSTGLFNEMANRTLVSDDSANRLKGLLKTIISSREHRGDVLLHKRSEYEGSSKCFAQAAGLHLLYRDESWISSFTLILLKKALCSYASRNHRQCIIETSSVIEIAVDKDIELKVFALQLRGHSLSSCGFQEHSVSDFADSRRLSEENKYSVHMPLAALLESFPIFKSHVYYDIKSEIQLSSEQEVLLGNLIPLFMKKGAELSKMGHFAAALSCITHALRIIEVLRDEMESPYNDIRRMVPILTARASILYCMNSFVQCVSMCDKVIELVGKDAGFDVWLLRGMSFLSLREFFSAIHDFKFCEKHFPGEATSSTAFLESFARLKLEIDKIETETAGLTRLIIGTIEGFVAREEGIQENENKAIEKLKIPVEDLELLFYWEIDMHSEVDELACLKKWQLMNKVERDLVLDMPNWKDIAANLILNAGPVVLMDEHFISSVVRSCSVLLHSPILLGEVVRFFDSTFSDELPFNEGFPRRKSQNTSYWRTLKLSREILNNIRLKGSDLELTAMGDHEIDGITFEFLGPHIFTSEFITQKYSRAQEKNIDVFSTHTPLKPLSAIDIHTFQAPVDIEIYHKCVACERKGQYILMFPLSTATNDSRGLICYECLLKENSTTSGSNVAEGALVEEMKSMGAMIYVIKSLLGMFTDRLHYLARQSTKGVEFVVLNNMKFPKEYNLSSILQGEGRMHDFDIMHQESEYLRQAKDSASPDTCAYCKEENLSESFVCSSCKTVFYCSEEHRDLHWYKEHVAVCVRREDVRCLVEEVRAYARIRTLILKNVENENVDPSYFIPHRFKRSHVAFLRTLCQLASSSSVYREDLIEFGAIEEIFALLPGEEQVRGVDDFEHYITTVSLCFDLLFLLCMEKRGKEEMLLQKNEDRMTGILDACEDSSTTAADSEVDLNSSAASMRRYMLERMAVLTSIVLGGDESGSTS